MKQDLNYMSKFASLVDIVDFLEYKYNIKNFNYQKVYYELRKAKPLLGINDCEYFCAYLLANNFEVKSDIHNEDESLCKLLFVSPVMKENYNLYGDIVLIDCTYKTSI